MHLIIFVFWELLILCNMSEKMTYAEHLKSPAWQRRRLEIMHRDNFMCVSCGENGKTLNVHHRVMYRKNTPPQDYLDTELITLCEECHERVTSLANGCKDLIMQMSYGVVNMEELYALLLAISETAWDVNKITEFAKTLPDGDF